MTRGNCKLLFHFFINHMELSINICSVYCNERVVDNMQVQINVYVIMAKTKREFGLDVTVILHGFHGRSARISPLKHTVSFSNLFLASTTLFL